VGRLGLKITFLGTKGYIEESSRLHRMHSAVLLECAGKRLLLDAGQTWAGRLSRVRPDWIAITHAHPDHSFGLAEGTAAPVYVSAESYERLKRYPVKRFRVFDAGDLIRLGPFRVRPYDVIHSIRAPAVGFRIHASRTSLVYNPDVISIPDEADVLRNVALYIGDGASLTRPLVRRRGPLLFGHTTVRAQLKWCERHRIPRAYITHCGKQIVEMNPAEGRRRIAAIAPPGVHITIAHDGLTSRFP
jgi:ribonuclease BN (tRNA processing enzyme)